MKGTHRFGFAIAACSMLFAPAMAQEGKTKKSRIEIRWVEKEKVDGLTEKKGFQTSCDPDDLVYPHKKPALVLTAAEVEDVRLDTKDFSSSGLSTVHMVTIYLTDEAKKKLAASVEGDQMRLLTVSVNGKNWGVKRYEKDKNKRYVPKQARAESLVLSVGYFASFDKAQQVVDSLK